MKGIIIIMETAITVSFQVAVMFILISFGFMCSKFKIISNDVNKQLSNFVITVVNPVLMFVSYQKEFKLELVRGLLTSSVLALASSVMLILFSMLFVRKKGNKEWNIERFAIAYTNCGFMGIPLIDSLYGSDGIFYLTAYITIFNILMWTHGVLLVSETKDTKEILRAFKSPSLIAIAVGLILFFLKVSLPDIIIKPMNYIAGLNTPLAMVVSGVTIAQTNILSAIKKPRVYFIALLKLLVIPLIVMLIFKPFNISEPVLNTILIASACPTAASTIMFAYKFNKNAFYASEVFALSTLLSAISLPLFLIISSFI